MADGFIVSYIQLQLLVIKFFVGIVLSSLKMTVNNHGTVVFYKVISQISP